MLNPPDLTNRLGCNGTFFRVHKNIFIIGDLWETHWRPQHASLETDMPDQRLTCLINDPLEMDMFHQRPTCLWRPTCQSEFKHIYLNIYFLLIYIE